MTDHSNLHARIRRNRGRATEFSCVDCSKTALDWSHITGSDPLDLMNYEPRCRSCHMRYDWRTGVREMTDDQRRWFQEHIAKVRRALSGSTNGRARLTETEVLEIRSRYAGGATQVELSAEYGIKQTTVSAIVTRKTWQHLTD